MLDRNKQEASVTDPVTVGMLVAGALSLGSEASKTAIGEVVKDAYQALKAKMAGWAAGQGCSTLLDRLE
jgi:hypothetical protein